MLNVLLLRLSAQVTDGQHVELVFLGVELAVSEPEADAADEGDDGHGAVVPNEQRVRGQRVEGLANGRRDGRHEKGEGGDERTHVLWGLAETVFERGDGGEDFRNGDEHISAGLRPNVDRNVVARGGLVAALGVLVDVGLDHARPNHGHAAHEKTGRDLLDGREFDSHLAEARVDDHVANRNQNDEREGVQVRNNVVGDAVQGHGRGLRRQVVVQLVVREPVQGVPKEHLASLPTTANFIDPGIIKDHPLGPILRRNARGLQVVPKGAVMQALVKRHWVPVESGSSSAHEKPNGQAENATLRGGVLIPVAAGIQNWKGKAEEDSGDQVRQVKSHISLRVRHGELSDQSANVDEQVEPVVNPGSGDGRVDEDAFARLQRFDVHSPRNLFSDEWRNVGLKATRSDSHNNETNAEAGKRVVRVLEDAWGS